MTAQNLAERLAETAEELVATSTPESRTHRIDVLAEWLATLLASDAPDAVPRLLALEDPDTGAPVEEVTGTARLRIHVERDGETGATDRLLVRSMTQLTRRR
ncbi:MAG: hypothetical protein ACKO5K_15165 [Armatimonadota bacterium]